MMRTTRIRTISRADINALAYQGIMPSECYPQLRSTIERHFDEEHASLLAEPVFNAREGFIDWYVAFEGPVTCYASLDSAGQKEACERFRKLASDIVLYADELICSGDAQKVTRGHLLKLALRYPSDQDLFLVGDRVTATCWGYAPGTSGAQSAMLCDLRVREEAAQETVCVEEKEGASPQEAREEKRKTSWLPWLFPLFLLALLFCLLFADFGKQKALSGISLFHLPHLFGEEISLADLEEKRRALASERSRLEESVLAHLSQCRLPKKVQEAIIQEKPSEEKPTEPPLEELAIPTNVQNTAFLAGRWLCATGLFNSKTQEPVQVEFVFDAEGQGIGTIFEKNDVCTGKASAKLDDSDGLVIAHEILSCQASKAQYEANTILCRKNDQGKTACQGRNTDGDPWNAVFLKIREP